MANQTLASLAITMRANAAELVQEVRTARQSLAGLGEMMKGLAGAATGAAVAMGTIAVTQANAIRETKLWADQLGISTQRLTELSAVFQQTSNIDGEQFNDMLQELNNRLGEAAVTGGGALAEAFEVIGLKVDDVRKLKTDEMILTIADAFKVLDDQQALTFASAEIFAGEGEKIVEILKQGRGPIEDMVKGFRDLNGVISDEEARKTAEFATGMKKIQTAFSGLATELTIFLAGPGADAANWVTQLIKDVRQFDDAVNKSNISDQIMAITDQIDPLIEELKGLETTRKFVPLDDSELNRIKEIRKEIREYQDQISELQGESASILPGTTTADMEAAEKAKKLAEEAGELRIKQMQKEAAEKKRLAEEAAARKKQLQEAFGGDPDAMFERMQEQNSTELQILNKHLEDKQELMKKFAKYNIGTEEERGALLNKISKKHIDATFKLQKKEDDKLKAHKDKFMTTMLTANVRGSKAMLSVQKAFRVAEAVMEGKSAVMSAYKWGNSVGGPVVGAAFAATAAVFSAQQVAAIASGGESSASSAATGAASTPDVSTLGTDEIAAANDEPQTTKTITVSFEGEGELVPRSVLRELAEELNSLDDSNVRISI